MTFGFFVPNLGPAATPEGISTIARRSEERGFASLWVTDRLLVPTRPTRPHPGSADGLPPEAHRYALDPVAVLTFAAALTSHIRLGTSVLIASYLNPVVLARQLTTLDILSGGRVVAGLGVGANPEEFTATGGDLSTRGRRMDEFLDLLVAVWTENPVTYEGKFFTVPESSILPKPVQRPHPPIALATNSAAAVRRAARVGAAIHPVNAAGSDLADLVVLYRSALADAGRDARAGQVILRAEIALSDRPLGSDRAPYHGTVEQVADDVEDARRSGATEVLFDPSYAARSLSEFEDYLDALTPVAAAAT
ncbi:TIGR03619 family F420-dependent LLM class oxidoreductase [Pseudonocardia sp. MH-G8]|uniref:TIGR03619 family F420-dependent LLM class oxidoreductase n=1 Tax=Pseudonocardia sp. MH-G8 TaxID=1854588 RepID=UPI000BA06692|nr:TIGR03619 family F420-dependent LLM class oxidoreductase [Pseudonocardia sp. MH-G8]OZM80777.1 LLM class F420-dependent oxidoreductase [Pseudonocardia sp. MH-G8]